MKRVRMESMEDFENLPEDEWVEVVGGMKFTVVDDTVHVEGGELVVPLPARVRAQFKLKEGDRLEARQSKGQVIVSRRRPKRGRSGSRG